MCIAIVKTKDGKISDTYLKNCFNNNSDGAGLAYSHDGNLYYVKGIFDVKEFIDQVRKAEELADGAMLIHCRISTSGLVDKDNCHPHVVNSTTVMIHNGILDIDVPKDSKKSDTVLFVEQLLAPLPEDFMSNQAIIDLITYTIGAGNKFCFLNNKGEYAIANEDAGTWKDGVWYSNTSYSYDRTTYYSWGKSSKKSGGKSYYGSYGWGYDDDDDYYGWGSNYGKDEDELFLTDKEILKIKDIIVDLTDEEVTELGECPVYDFWVGELKSEGKYEGDGDAYLIDLNKDLQDLYDLKFGGYDKEFDEHYTFEDYANSVFEDLEHKVYGYDDEDEDDEDVIDTEVIDTTDDDLDEYEDYTDVDYSDDFNDRYKPSKNNIVIMK